LKAVLLHNGSEYPSVPVFYSDTFRESYEVIEKVLNLINYNQYNWAICGDLKIIAIMLGLKGGYSKYPCFLCNWDSRDDKQHWIKRDWPLRKNWTLNECGVQSRALIPVDKVLIPPLHIKLGIMKQFISKLAKNESPAFNYIRKKFSKVSEAKLRNGVFVGPQIRKLMNDAEFYGHLNENEKSIWNAFRDVINGFLRNNRSPNYRQNIDLLLSELQAYGCRMSIKLHFLNAHVDYFPGNVGQMSEEQGERFHQELKDFEKRYHGKISSSILADYCWNLVRESDSPINPARFFKPIVTD
jgi:hypothetical protein